MKKRSVKNCPSTNFSYEQLEARQLLTSWWAGFDPTTHIPQDGSATVQQDLTSAPDISRQPEHGELTFDETNGTLTYRPDQGFTGADSFQLGDRVFSMRIWESVYAVSDWTHVRPGSSTTINVLDNDYSFRKPSIPTGNHFRVFYDDNSWQWQQDSTGLSIVDFTSSSGARVSISQDGQSLNYSPATGFSGTDSLTYTLEDSAGHRSVATVTIDVSEQNADGHYYISEAQWKQERIDSWLERYAPTLTQSNFYWGGIFGRPSIENVMTFAVLGSDSFSLDQVTDVQEGDIVKAHGNFLYYVSHSQGEGGFASYLSIVDVSDPNSPQVVSITGFEQRIRDIFLGDGRAAVIFEQDYGVYGVMEPAWISRASVDPEFQMLVLDISDAQTPTEVYRATIDGNYKEARLIGDELFVISDTGNGGMLTPWDILNDDSIGTAVSPGDYIDAMSKTGNAFQLPAIIIDSNGVSKTTRVSAGQVVNRDNTDSSTLIATFNLQSTTGTPVDIDLVGSNFVQTVYVSTNAMYLFDGMSVVKLSFVADAMGVEFSADGQLNASLLGQFSADEYNGYLRVAVTDWTDRSSDVRIFSQVDDDLVVVGSIEDIAPGESIYSTLFAEDQVFVVTFRQIDPLFVIDLSNPTSPKISGELKIPGVSGYLQLIGDDLLLAVGRDADEASGQFGALQISLFDVSDPNAPKLLDRYSFEGGRSTMTPLIEWLGSAAEQHALTFDPATGTVALPIYSIDGWGDSPIFQGENSAMSLFQVDREHGIRAIGQADFDSRALRTVIVGENLVYLSEDGMQVAARIAPNEILAKMELPVDEATRLTARPVAPPVEQPTRAIEPVKEELTVLPPDNDNGAVVGGPSTSEPIQIGLASWLIGSGNVNAKPLSASADLDSLFMQLINDRCFVGMETLAGSEQLLASDNAEFVTTQPERPAQGLKYYIALDSAFANLEPDSAKFDLRQQRHDFQ